MLYLETPQPDSTRAQTAQTTHDAQQERATDTSAREIVVISSQRRKPQFELEWHERLDMLRSTAAKAEAIFATIAILWGVHILTFDHTYDPVAKAMQSLLDFLPGWGWAAILIGVAQFYGAYFRVHALRENAAVANLAFMLFVWIAMLQSRTWTPGVIVTGGYIAWLYEIYRYLRLQRRYDQLSH